MAQSTTRATVRLKSNESRFTYYTTKNKRNTPAALALKKYDPLLRRHVVFKETR